VNYLAAELAVVDQIRKTSSVSSLPAMSFPGFRGALRNGTWLSFQKPQTDLFSGRLQPTNDQHTAGVDTLTMQNSSAASDFCRQESAKTPAEKEQSDRKTCLTTETKLSGKLERIGQSS